MKALLPAVLLLAPRAASACAVCFGALDGQTNLTRAFWWGVVILIAVTMCMVGGIGWFLWSVEKGRAEQDA